MRPERLRTHPKRLRALAGAAVAVLLAGLVPAVHAPAAFASTGGALTTEPVSVTQFPISADGTTSGQLKGKIDLPVLLGDHGSYVLQGATAPEPDASGNGAVQLEYPAGPVFGVVTDPEDGEVDDEPGEGIDIGESRSWVSRTPSGLRSATELNDVVLDITKLNEKVGAVLGRSEIMRADRIVTEAAARVDGDPAVSTRVEGLTVLGAAAPLVDGRLAEPFTQSMNVQSNDVVALLRSLGVKPEDIDQYAGLISSSSMTATLTLKVSSPADGGLAFTAHIDLRLKANAILNLGAADVRANQVVLEGTFARATAARPEAIAPAQLRLAEAEVEAGGTAAIHGIGFVEGGTTVRLAGSSAEIVELAADGTSLVFRVPTGLRTSDYEVQVETIGGSASAGELRVRGDDFVPLSVAGITPATSADGREVHVTGAGFPVGETSVLVTDAAGEHLAVDASDVTVEPSGLGLSFRLPEGLALGTATVAVISGAQRGTATIEIVAAELPPVAPSGAGIVTGIVREHTPVPLTVDNSSTMTWKAPTLISPAGEAGSSTELSVGLPPLNQHGLGSTSANGAGLTGTVTREANALVASAEGQGYGLTLPAPWDGFFAQGNVVTADRVAVTARAQADGRAENSVALENLRVLGTPVALVDGRLQQAQEFTVSLDSSTLKNRQAMDNVFWSAANEGYSRLKSETQAQLFVRIEPVAASAATGSATAGAFRVVADLRYRYNGENSGFVKTRARHGSGGSRDGDRVPFFSATVGSVSVQAPTPLVADVTALAPRFADAGDAVTVSGRGFSADSIVLFGNEEVTPTSIAPDGASLIFRVPSGATGTAVVAVRTAAGTSATSRQLAIKEAPLVTEQPRAVSVTEGGTAVFTARASGSPRPSITWQREQAGEWVALDEHGERLSLVASAADNGAAFRAVFRSAAGEATSDTVTLDVQHAPVFTAQPVIAPLTAGTAAPLSADVVANPAASVVWQINRGGGWLSIGEGARVDYTPTPADHGARLRARATNAIGTTTSAETELSVSYSPQITLHPADATARDGETASFTAAAHAVPAANVYWQMRSGLGAGWVPVDAEQHPSAVTATLVVPASLDQDGTEFRAVFANGVGGAATTNVARLTVTAGPGLPGDGVFSALGSPLTVGAQAMIATGQATGGALSGLINAELSRGAEIGESGRFQLPESGTPTERGGVIERTFLGSRPAGSGIGDLAGGTSYGDTLVRNTWHDEGITSQVGVDSFRVDHRALDNKGRIGALLGIDEIVNANVISASANAPSDEDFPTSSSASIGTLAVLGQPLGAADGFVSGRLAAPVTREHAVTIEDFPSVLAQLGVDPSAYLSEELLGEASARVIVTVSQPRATDQDTASATGLHISARAELDLFAETQGGDRALVETITLSTNGPKEVFDISVATTMAARAGVELPAPSEGTGTVEEPEQPGVQIPDLPLRDLSFYAPSAEPSRVVQTVTGDAATSRTVTWRTDESVSQAVLEIREPGATDAARVAATTREALDRTGTQSGQNLRYRAATHVATAEGLAPDTAYSYRVGDGGENWSPWYEFRTASTAAKPFTFLYAGDAQNDLRKQWEGGVQTAYETVPEAELMLHAGDLINHADNDVQWGEWFASAPEQNAQIPQLPVTGNHEFLNGGLHNAWQQHFSLPLNGPTVDPSAGACEQVYQRKIVDSLAGSVYSVDYQGVRFVSLSGTVGLVDFLPDAASLAAAGCTDSVDAISEWLKLQSTFLDRALAENPGQWSVVSIHQPLFSTSAGRGNPHLRDAYLEILERHNVDLVLQGHDHTYGRGHLSSNELAGTPGVQDGPVYVVSVLGPKFYDLDRSDQNDWARNGATRVTAHEFVRTFQEITIDGGRLSYRAHEYGTGELADSFEICKNPQGAKLVAESAESLPSDCAQTPAVDAAAESLTPLVSGEVGAEEWIVSPAAVSLQGADALPAGMRIEARLGQDAEWAAFPGSAELPDGVSRFEYRVVDANGATSAVRHHEVKVDTAAPIANSALSGRQLALRGADEHSGLARVEHRLDGGEWSSYTAPLALDERAHTVEFRAVDRAGNVSAVQRATVATTAPEGQLTLQGLGGDRAVIAGTELTGLAARLADASDASVSGQRVRFELSGGATFAGGATEATAITNAAGIAVAPKVTVHEAGEVRLVAHHGAGTAAVSTVASVLTVSPAAAELRAGIAVSFSKVAGRVALTADVTNASGVPVELRVKTKYGSTTIGAVAPGATVSKEFRTFLPSVPAGAVEVTVTDGSGTHNLVIGSYAAVRAADLG